MSGGFHAMLSPSRLHGYGDLAELSLGKDGPSTKALPGESQFQRDRRQGPFLHVFWNILIHCEFGMAVYQTLLAYCAPSQPAHKVRGAIPNKDVRDVCTPQKK